MSNFRTTFGAGLAFLVFATGGACAQKPVIVQPGAPGEATKVLPDNKQGTLAPATAKDIEFMQGMIMHHAQAVEMTALIEERTTNAEVRKLGAKINQAQADEMEFMKRWLTLRGQSTEMKGHEAAPANDPHAHHSGHDDKSAKPAAVHTMPGMLTPEQMEQLRKSKGAEFDKLFLRGMILHHEGALAMVKDLFDTPGSGQDSELFNFASDVDTGQRAEINTMKTLLGEKP